MCIDLGAHLVETVSDLMRGLPETGPGYPKANGLRPSVNGQCKAIWRALRRDKVVPPRVGHPFG